MNEKPLERLNYYNGQRLEASDFKTEQDYHMRTRRWLNKSLYSAGIARGLEVRAVPGFTRVVVSPGLALDSDGREIILLEEATVEVISFSGSSESTVEGNYLVIEYTEETIAYEKGGCAVRTADKCASKSTTNWGGPSRIQSQVKFSWVPFVPHPGSNQIVLARVELAEGCRSVYQIDPGARHYIGAASAATVRQYALEGEREVAFIPSNSFPAGNEGEVGDPMEVKIVGKIYFHIRGRQPNSVTLYLKAEEMSPLHYTELATHNHSLSVSGSTDDPIPELKGAKTEHKHKIPDIPTEPYAYPETGGDDNTKLHLKARKGYIGHSNDREEKVEDEGRAAFFLIERNWGVKLGLAENVPGDDAGNFFDWLGNKINDLIGGSPTWAPETDDAVLNILKPTNGVIYGGNHNHIVHGETESKDSSNNALDLTHKHGVSGSGVSGFTGNQDILTNQGRVVRSGKPFMYFADIQIAIDGVDRSIEIRDQIMDSVSDADQKRAWQNRLGTGADNHPLAHKDIEAVPIRLDFLPHVTFGEGQHVIEFFVGPTPGGEANGGKIHYNLYVE
ncbi:MAG: hypothetical protein WAW02_10205 [Sideroxyarcus sp.]